MFDQSEDRSHARTRIICLILIITATLCLCAYGLYRTALQAAIDYYRSQWCAFSLTNQKYDYSESTAKISGIGGSFYHLTGYLLGHETTPQALAERLQSETEWYKNEELVLIEINLKNYNHSCLSETALSQTDQILDVWSQAGYRIILRFLYDWDGRSIDTEPKDIRQIKQHMTQLAPIINEHAGNIYTMQGIFVGDVAEMHGGNHMDPASMRTLMEHLDKVTDPGIFLSVRTPAHRRTILGSASVFPAGNQLAARLGLFNDGMLGSGNDLGTYGDTDRLQSASLEDHWLREQELDYQDELCRFVPNGGEAVIDNPLNDLDQAVSTLSRMHVSYLNCMHHDEVIRKWRTQTIQSDDDWNGTSGYDYLDAHMGCRYRCVAASADTFDCWSQDAATVHLTFTNTGFAGSYEPLSLSASIVSDADGSIVSSIVWDEAQLATLCNGETLTLSLPLKPRALEEGNYIVCISCYRTNTGEPVALATKLPRAKAGYEAASFSINKTPNTISSARELLDRYFSHLRSSEN